MPKFKKVMTYSPRERLVRLCRWTWTTVEGRPTDAGIYEAFPVSNQLTLGLRPSLFNWTSETYGWILTILFLRIHRKRSYGGIYVD